MLLITALLSLPMETTNTFGGLDGGCKAPADVGIAVPPFHLPEVTT